MKTLANCAPREFLKQANRIRKSVESWLNLTDAIKILRTKPQYETLDNNASAEDRKAVIERNSELERKQTRENLSKVLDVILEEHPDETLEMLALCCFIEPDDIDNHVTGEYLQAASELISDQYVINFFTSLMRWDQTSISTASKA